MPESSLSLTRSDLLRYVGRELGYKRNPSEWNDRERTDGDDVLSSGLRQFYNPPVLPGEATAHRWTFLRPVFSMLTKSSVGDYDLPDDFGGIDGQLYFGSALVGHGPLIRVGEQWILNCRQGNSGITGYPRYYAIAALPGDGDEPQRFTLMLEPIPSEEHELKGQYRVNPYVLSDSKPYPLGGQPHAETILASCIAAAHKFLKDERLQAAWADYLTLLASSVAHDRAEMGPRNLGKATTEPYVYRRALEVTFDGALPT